MIAEWLTALFLVATLSAGPADEKAVEAPKPLPIHELHFSPDGATLAAVSSNWENAGRLVVYDLAGGRVRAVHDDPTGIFSAAFLSDGKEIAVGLGSGVVRLMDAETMRTRRELPGHTAMVRVMVVSPDGKMLATGGEDDTVRLWSLPGGDVTRTIAGHGGNVFKLAMSSLGKTLVTYGRDEMIRLRTIPGGEVRETWDYPAHGLSTAVVSRDDRFYVLYSNRFLRIRDSDSGLLRARLLVIGGPCALSADTRTLAVTRSGTIVNLYDIRLDEPPPDVRERIAALIARWNDDDYAVREAATREIIEIGMLAISQLRTAQSAESPEIRVRAQSATDRIWTPEPRRTLTVEGGYVTTVAFSPDGRRLAVGDRNGRVTLWNPETGERAAILAPP